MAAKKKIRIEGVRPFRQTGGACYSFVLSSQQLLDLCRVDRFDDSEAGVQRQTHQGHVDDLLTAVLNQNVLFLEPFVVWLEGKWRFTVDALYGQPGCYLSVDDGQHRLEMLRRLKQENSELFDRLEFVVTAMPLDMSFAERVRLFLQQGERKPVDKRLQLAQRDQAGLWKSPFDETAYRICMALHEDADSPLCGLLDISDSTSSRAYERGGKITAGINIAGVFKVLLRVLGPKSPLSKLTLEQQIKVVKTYLRIAAEEVWPHAWNKSTHILSTAKGIDVLLSLFVQSPQFKAAVGTNLKEGNLRTVLKALSGFVWTSASLSGLNHTGIVRKIDAMLGRNLSSSAHIQVD